MLVRLREKNEICNFLLCAITCLLRYCSTHLRQAAFYLDRAAVVYQAELSRMPLDPEVLAADALAAKKAQQYAAATAWAELPRLARWALGGAVGLMVLCCYLVQLLACFVPYELTSRVDRDLPGGLWCGCRTLPLLCAFI